MRKRLVAFSLSLLTAPLAVASELPCGTVGGNPAAVEQALAWVSKKAAPVDMTVDVGLVYDSSFATVAGGDAPAAIDLILAVARANAGHAASHTQVQYRVVGVKKLNYNLDPHNPISSADSAETRSFRDQVGADLVVAGTLRLYNSAGIEVAGMAMPYDRNPATYLAVVGYYTMSGITPGHELGHLGGADHEPASSPPPTQPLPARAFYECPSGGGDGLSDMMVSGTSRPPGGCLWSRVNAYSSPTLIVNGVKLGMEGQADNASVLRATGPIVAEFRASRFDTGACIPGPTTLCLNNGRFRVESAWSANGTSGHGQAVALTGDTGYFWFFSQTNVEVIVKMLDGCGLNNRFWFFAGGLTNVEVGITVTDTQTDTVKTYYNTPGPAFAPVQDTGAFTTCP